MDHSAAFHTLFHVRDAHFDPRTLTYTVPFPPVDADNFSLLIERTAASTTPQSWRAELTQLQVFGTDAAANTTALSHAAPAADVDTLHTALVSTPFAPIVEDQNQTLAIRTPWYRIVLDKTHPRIVTLALDSLGKGELGVNLLQPEGAHPMSDEPFQTAIQLASSVLQRTGNVFRYAPVQIAPGVYEQVAIRANLRSFDLELAATAGRTVTMRGGLFRFQFAANQTPTTFLGRHQN